MAQDSKPRKLGKREKRGTQSAIDELIRLGFLQKFDAEHQYVHVRRTEGRPEGEWAPDPERKPNPNIVERFSNIFANSGANPESIDETEQDYGRLGATERVTLTVDSDETYIVNADFDPSKLSAEEQAKYKSAIETLGLKAEPSLSDITKYNPVDYSERDKIDTIYKSLMTVFKRQEKSMRFVYVKKFDPATKKYTYSQKFMPQQFITLPMIRQAVEALHPRGASEPDDVYEASLIRDLELAEQLAGAVNARTLLLNDPHEAIMTSMRVASRTYNTAVGLPPVATDKVRRIMTERSKSEFLNYRVKNKNGELVHDIIPFSPEYVSAWFADNEIVGLATDYGERGHKEGTQIYAFFDLDRVNSQAVIGKRLDAIDDTYDKLPPEFHKFGLPHSGIFTLEQQLESADSEEVIGHINYYLKRAGMDKYNGVPIFEMSSGVSEKYTIGEHTESVLRVFQRTFEPALPREIIPFMKLVLAVHDIGKGIAVEKEGRDKQKKYNLEFTDRLLTSMGLSPKLKEVIKFMIGESQDYTTAYYVRKDESALPLLYDRCQEILKEQFGIEDEGAIAALANMCMIVQNCDSISYTQYGTIRGTHGKSEGVYYKGGNKEWGEGVAVVGFQKPVMKGRVKRQHIVGLDVGEKCTVAEVKDPMQMQPAEEYAADTSTIRIEAKSKPPIDNGDISK